MTIEEYVAGLPPEIRQLFEQWFPLQNWLANPPAPNSQVDYWTNLANSRLEGWQGGNVLDAYGNNQVGFGPTPTGMTQQVIRRPDGSLVDAMGNPITPISPTDIPGAGGLIPSQGANTAYSNVFGGLNYSPTNGGRVGSNPYGNQSTYTAYPQWRPSYTTPAGSTVAGGLYGSIPLTQDQMNQFMATTGKTGQAFLNALPDVLRPTGVTDAMRNEYNAADAALRAAMQAGTVTPEISQRAADATTAIQMGTYGPLAKFGANYIANGGQGLSAANMLGAGGVYVPQVKDRTWHPTTQADLAAQYGYAPKSVVRKIPTGEIDPATGHPGFTMRADPQSVDSGNIMQTLKRFAGWDSSMGFGPQAFATNAISGQPNTPAQIKQYNDLLASIAPRNPSAATSFPKKWGAAAGDYLLPGASTPTEEAKPNPFVTMQGIADRNAYVNDTLGGGFYGGVIPSDAMQQTWTESDDPHFFKPQPTNPWSIERPNDATPGYDAYPGWASNSANTFGNSPWGALGGSHVWQPPQQATGTGNSWGTSPWGNMNGPWGNNK